MYKEEDEASEIELTDLGCSGEKGTYKCGGKKCQLCERVIEGNKFKSTDMGDDYLSTIRATCESKKCIYLVTCVHKNCGLQYVGKTLQTVRERHYQHNREIKDGSSPLGKHFRDHGIDNFRLQIIDQLIPKKKESDKNLDERLRKRETMWAEKLSTFFPRGINMRVEASTSSDNSGAPPTKRRK